MLTWDVIALNGYLLLNLHICGYLIYCAYCGRKPSKVFYVPFVFIAIVWAVSIHTVTAFLYVGLGRAAVLELGDHRPAVPGQRVRRRAGVHHPHAAGRAALHARTRSATTPC